MNRSYVFLFAILLTACASPSLETVIVSGKSLDPTAIKPTLPAAPLVLPLEVDMPAAETFIRLGFGLDESTRFQSTQMLTPRLRTAQAQQLIRLVKSYNNFDGPKVADALLEVRGQVSAVEFGREGSPVLYVDLPYWTHQREEFLLDGTGVKISDKDNDKLVKRLRATFVDKLSADEFSVDGRKVRIWWD